MTTADEGILRQMGDEAIGVVSGGWYAAGIDSPENKRFVAAVNKEYGADPGYYTLGAYSAGALVEAAARAVGGKVEDKDAFMETVNPDVPSTVEAAALCKMADRGQITGGILDGPLALDNAINLEAAGIKKIVSPVAGRANVLIVPDLEAGNMLAKSLSFLAGADSAGVVLGAKVPVILTSRADSVMARLASCAVAALVAQARRDSAARAIAA